MNRSISEYFYETMSKRPSLLGLCRTFKFWINYPIRRQRLKNQILTYSQTKHLDKKCPVCDGKECVEVEFFFEEVKIIKYQCLKCNHLFSLWLQSNLHKAQELFDYEQENIWKGEQQYLLREAVRFCGRKGKYLDFGVGGNISAIKELGCEMWNNTFYACDINERNEINYFKTYENDKMLGLFDGIASSNVVEHLDNTIEAWQYFNRLLKPRSDSTCTVMVHSFPSQLHYDFSHWGIQIQSHLSLFSKRSLEIICEKSGFEFIRWRWSGKLRFPIFYFKKVKDV